MRRLPPIDMHAHVDASIDPTVLDAIEGIVFAVSRSLDEADIALKRQDQRTIWGTGCHPGLVGAQRSFSKERFRDQLRLTPFVGEVGLDGKSRVPMATQEQTLRQVLEELRITPRITSVHSYAATEEVLGLLGEVCAPGIVLHWWLGSEDQTRAASKLGCYFSFNASSIKRTDLLAAIPLNRILAETDHPFGDRGRSGVKRPGNVSDVELAIGAVHGLSQEAVRSQMWANLAGLVVSAGVGSMLPTSIRSRLASI